MLSSPVIFLHKLQNSSENLHFTSLPRPMALSSPQGLRQRKLSNLSLKDEPHHTNGFPPRVIADEPEKPRPAREEVVWGKTPDGQGK